MTRTIEQLKAEYLAAEIEYEAAKTELETVETQFDAWGEFWAADAYIDAAYIEAAKAKRLAALAKWWDADAKYRSAVKYEAVM